MQEDGTYRIPDRNMWTLESKLAKLNKRAIKLGCAPVVLEKLGYEDVPEKREVRFGVLEETGRVIRFWNVKLVGEAPRVNGWEFIGTLQFVAANGENEAMNITRAVPGHEIPKQYRTASPVCDHCGFNRRRNDTFILKSTETPDTFKQVGRNCLQDFLRTDNGSNAAAVAEFLRSAGELADSSEDEDFGGGYGGRELFFAEEFLQRVSVAIRKSGWLSRGAAREYGKQSTVDETLGWIHTKRPAQDFPGWEIEESDRTRAAETMAWMQSLSETEQDNDYLANLAVIGSLNVWEPRMLGLAGSAITAFARAQEREIERRKRAESHKASEFFGEAGKRQPVTLTLEFMREFDSQYGVTTLHKFVTPEGNVAVWWKSGESDLKVGETYTGKGTVKKHEVREDEKFGATKQTVLTRVAF